MPLLSKRRRTGPTDDGCERVANRRAPSSTATLRARSGRSFQDAPALRPIPVHETELCRLYRAAAANLSARLVSIEMGVSVDALHARTRCTADIAFARQVALYLTSTVFDIGHTEVGHRFGRDRTTVRHACARVEDRRDDREFEARLVAMEALLCEAREAIQLFAVQADTMTERVLVEIGAAPREGDMRR